MVAMKTGTTSRRRSPRPAPPRRKPSAAPIPAADSVPIIGLGASAGGLEALEAFLQGVPEASGLAFVVVQHLDPTHEALLGELLQRKTRLPVVEVRDHTRVERDHVYVIPPNRDMTVLHGVLHLFVPASPRGQRLPIDLFLRTLAEDRRERSVAIILSGMGTDGTLGVRAIKEAAGLVLAQTPTDAKFDGMPRSAIDTGLVDVVAPASELCGRALSLLAHPSLVRSARATSGERSAHVLEKVLVLLRSRTGQDFSSYKRSTLDRRIERRMGVHQIPHIQQYLRFVQENPPELDLLFKELLIGVTGFFRDPAAWDLLLSQALPTLIDGCPDGGTLRAWTPGCSTGEEAYSLAMAFREALALHRPGRRLGCRIFATDLDAAAVQRARQASFPPNILADVSSERLARFFVAEEGAAAAALPERFRIAREIREMVTLATHNVLTDPPFTRMDLILCRNLLIYLEPEAQRKLLSIFHYSLNPGGVLFLGTAETIGGANDLFAPLDTKLRIFRRRESAHTRSNPAIPTAAGGTLPARARPSQELRPAGSLQVQADQILLQRFSPAAVLVNAEGDILYVSGRTGKYLEPAAGKANLNLFAMAREGLRHELPRALRQAAAAKEPVTIPRLRVKTNGDFQTVDLTVQALDAPEGLRGNYFVVFGDVAASPVRAKGARARGSTSPLSPGDATEEEVRRLREDLLSIQQEMQASQEELKSANEELQSANEELQSTNEELTTSKEEMQSLNEELQTVNAELQSKLDELLQANNDMKNLLNSTEIATLFLDEELNIRRFTTRATRIFKLIPGDVGRPITDIVTDLDYDALSSDAEDVLRTLTSIEKQVKTRDDGRWFSARLMPYRTVDNVIDGLVLTFSDITAAKNLEAELRRLGGARTPGGVEEPE
jgi:two-component system CheB/CheR fusion protein